MTTFKQLMKEGVLKRADSHKVRLQDIVVAEGFNKRDEGERLQQHIRALADFIKAGGQLPPLEVKPLDNGKVRAIDGHCRRAILVEVEFGKKPDATVMVSGAALLKLLQSHANMNEARQQAEAKAREHAAKAAQADLTEAA